MIRDNDSGGRLPAPAEQKQDTGNNLFPAFIKLENLRLLIVGGGKVGLEKLKAVLQNSPATRIKLVAATISDDVKKLAGDYPSIMLVERPYLSADADEADLVICAVNDGAVSRQIRADAHARQLLINVADTPDLCDFYLSAVVKKGNLKIAISTNGKSPTIAKRLKEEISTMIPDEMDDVLDDMQTIRKGMRGDFNEKVKQLNDLTKVLAAKQAKLGTLNDPQEKKWPRIVTYCLFAFFFMILGHAILWFVPLDSMMAGLKTALYNVDGHTFFIMVLTGFLAQMVDGSLGMGYGTISTTFLLAHGISPAIVSSRVHSARVFSSGVSGYSHHRFGNINKKLFKALVIPGVVGAIIGATLAFYGQRYATWVRIPLSLYTIYLGYFIIRKAFRKASAQDKVKRAGWLAATGGLLDAFAGGGWGALVTSTLIAKRKTPRFVIGSVCLAEFFVVLASSITFFLFLKNIPLMDVAGLIAGGLVAAPIAARLVGKLPLKAMFIGVGTVVILTSTTTLWKALSQLW